MKFRPSQSKAKHIVCGCCGKPLEGNLPALTYAMPAYWDDDVAQLPNSELGSDFCCIEGKSYFIRAVLQIPIIDSDQTLDWGVWVSLSETNAKRYSKVYGTPAELEEPIYFGWFSNILPDYPNTLNLKANVHLQGGNCRPLIELQHENDHPLCQEQHLGITLERAHEIIRSVLGSEHELN
ncbi:MAG: DUF2199 domain-containing protein [Candidatus Saccharimonadales bacterium]